MFAEMSGTGEKDTKVLLKKLFFFQKMYKICYNTIVYAIPGGPEHRHRERGFSP